MTTALITGASSGIGEAFAHVLAKDNINLILVARSQDKLQRIQEELPKRVNVQIITQDLTEPNAAQTIHNQVPHIDILINNAGFGDKGEFHNSKNEKITQMIQLNILALTQLTHLYLKHLIETKGKILNVASIVSFFPGPYMATYCASKAYVLSFSQALSKELQGKVTVSCLCPGPTRSNFAQTANFNAKKTTSKRKRIPTSLEVAKFGYNALKKGKAVAVHGTKNKLITTAVRFIPQNLVRKIMAKVLK